MSGVAALPKLSREYGKYLTGHEMHDEIAAIAVGVVAAIMCLTFAIATTILAAYLQFVHLQ